MLLYVRDGEAAAEWHPQEKGGKKKKIKPLSHIHFTRSVCGNQAAGEAEEEEEEAGGGSRCHTRLPISASSQLVEFLGDVFQLRLDGRQTLNLRIL